MKSWKPSKRASELIGVLWTAFETGDRYVKLTNPSTARMTGESLVWNGVAEWDENGVAGRRLRLSTETLALNGYPTRDWREYVRDMAEMEAEDEAMAVAA